jgi:hypothetical protein
MSSGLVVVQNRQLAALSGPVVPPFDQRGAELGLQPLALEIFSGHGFSGCEKRITPAAQRGRRLASLEWARRQRTSTSLARLWQSQGRREHAYELLEPVFRWFTEGFDTKDLLEAKSLLASCGVGSYVESAHEVGP